MIFIFFVEGFYRIFQQVYTFYSFLFCLVFHFFTLCIILIFAYYSYLFICFPVLTLLQYFILFIFSVEDISIFLPVFPVLLV